MKKIKLDPFILKKLSIFSSVSKIVPKDCFESNGTLVFMVNKGDIGRAVGKKAGNIPILAKKLNVEKIRCGMVLPILYFLFDFVFLGVSNNWSVRLLLTYFIFYMCIHHKDRFITKHSIGILLLFLAQDVFIYGRFGISLLYLAPILLCMFISSFFCDIKICLVYHLNQPPIVILSLSVNTSFI